MEHTPTPWAYYAPDFEIYYADGDVEPRILTMTTDNCSESHAQVDAEFIVRAVNSHDEFVALLSDALECLKRLPSADGAYRVSNIKQIEMALARMKQA